MIVEKMKTPMVQKMRRANYPKLSGYYASLISLFALDICLTLQLAMGN
jgi:hypothetical protein